MKKNVNEILTTKRQKYMTVLTVLLLLISVGLFSYALTYNINYVGLNTNKISNCSIDISFKDNNPVRLTSSYPMDYATAKEYDPYTFYIKSNSNNCESLSYRISMKSICSTCATDSCDLGDGQTCNCTSGYQIDESLINYELKNVTTGEIITGEGINELNQKFKLNGVETDTYEMRIWISEKATNSDLYVDGNSSTPKNYCGKLNVEVVASGNLDISGANEPELATGMIPVYYDETSEVWKKADSNNKDANNKWYDYDNKMWANAVTVSETNRDNYLKAAVGTEISMNDINTMWVWIPRFSATGDTANYNGGTKANPGAFDITFVDNKATAHDAFTFGTQELNGFWVGKFETSHETLSSSETADNLGCTSDTCSNANEIIIKPNVVSLRYNNVSNFYYANLSMKQSGNSFGFDNTIDTTLDTHMMKNNEWGAVAYLTQSIYGRCTSSTSCTEVYINNSNSYYTGRSGGNASGNTPINGTYPDQTSTTQYNTYGFYTYDGYLLEYNTNNKTTTRDMSKVSSTTGNIYGIYDMSGGAYEYVMGVYTDGTQNWSGNSSTLNSGFGGCLGSSCSSTYDGVAYPESRYYNSYTTSTNYTTANLQHALVETQNWFGDYAYFVNGSGPWLGRGGLFVDGSYAGVFYYGKGNGGSVSGYGSRSSLIIN